MIQDVTELDLDELLPDAPEIFEVSALTMADVERSVSSDVHRPGPHATVVLRQRHHKLAACVAAGMSYVQAASQCGYTPEYVSLLVNNNPAFQGLVEEIRKEENSYLFDYQNQMLGLASDALGVLQERIDEKPGEFTVKQLLEIAQAFSDRTGHGPQSRTEVDVNVGIASRMDAARARVKAARLAQVEDATIVKDEQ